MGKAEFGTPKYLANKMKAKGLQKLRWYCQMCQKQCRDENGFKCHTMSESHQRQLLLFADNSRRYIDTFSKEFADGYIEILRRQFGTKRVAANKVYQEYISDRNHLHMNATKWVTLTGFVQWLGRTGQCVVDETEKGWFITYIDRDPDTIARQEKLAKKVKMDKDDEERMMEFLEKQIEKGKKEETDTDTDNTDETSKEFIRENDDEKITLNITSTSTKVKSELTTVFKMPTRPLDNKRALNDDACSTSSHRSKKANTSKKSSALDDIIKQEELSKEKKNRKDYWLAKGIVVKLMTKTLGDKYYKEKAVVIDVIDKYVGKIKLIESGEKIKVDQEHLETVIPAIGKKVLILNGGYRNSIAVLKQLNEMNYSVTVEIDSGVLKGRIVNNIKYEDISKINDM